MRALRGLLTGEAEPSLPSSILNLDLRLPFGPPWTALHRRSRRPRRMPLTKLPPVAPRKATTPLASADLCGPKLGPAYPWWVGDGEDFCG